MKKILLNTQEFSPKETKEINGGFVWGILQGAAIVGTLVLSALSCDKAAREPRSSDK